MTTAREQGEVLALPQKLVSFIATRDRKVEKFWPHSPNHLADLFGELLSVGVVTVGGRSTCGGSDPTMSALRMWNEVVKKARSLGYAITENQVRGLANAWATRGGGFWNESEYRLVGLRPTTKESLVVRSGAAP